MNEQNVTAKIERILSENKTGLKTYATYENAVKAAEKEAAEHIRGIFGADHPNEPRPCTFLPAYIPSTGRFTPVFLFNNWHTRNPVGGFVGHFAQAGFLQH